MHPAHTQSCGEMLSPYPFLIGLIENPSGHATSFCMRIIHFFLLYLNDFKNVKMRKKIETTLKIVGFIAPVSILFPFIVYKMRFSFPSLSYWDQDWNMFSLYVSSTVVPIISFWTLLVTSLIVIEFNSYQSINNKIMMKNNFNKLL